MELWCTAVLLAPNLLILSPTTHRSSYLVSVHRFQGTNEYLLQQVASAMILQQHHYGLQMMPITLALLLCSANNLFYPESLNSFAFRHPGEPCCHVHGARTFTCYRVWR